MPTITLVRGANASVTQNIPTATTVTIGFTWNVVQATGPTTEVVACAIACGQDGKAVSAQHVVFFNQLLSPDEAITYEADGSLPGGDNEQIEVDLQRVPSNITTIALLLYVNPDLRQPGTFESVRDPVVRVRDRSGGEVIRYPIESADLGATSAVVAGELYRRQNEWKFRAVGQGYAGGVSEVAAAFGFSL